MLLNSKTLDLRKTIDMTMSHNKNFLFQKTESEMKQDSKLFLDVRFLGDKLPYTHSVLNQYYNPDKPVDYSKLPIFMEIHRDSDLVRLTRNPIHPDQDDTLYSYSMYIKSSGLSYFIIQAPDGYTADTGNSILLDAIQYDADLSNLIKICTKPNPAPPLHLFFKAQSRSK